MRTLVYAVFGVPLILAQPALAVEVTGGSIGLSYSTFTEDADLNSFGIEGSVELGFNRNISLQLDLGRQEFGFTDVGTNNIGVHGIYHIDDNTSLGAFLGREDLEGNDLDYYGLEAGHETDAYEFEGYLGRLEADGEDANGIGVSARYLMANQLGVTGAYDRIDFSGDADVSRASVRLDRDVSPAVNLFVEVGAGRASLDGVAETDTFVGIGGKFVFGAERGATFEQRGLGRLIPGL